MPLIPSKLNFLPEFDGRDSLYSSLNPAARRHKLTIRILTVMPNQDLLAPIEASLSIANLSVEGQRIYSQYKAVSYYWGNTNELENVKIHGSDEGNPGLVHEVPVTKNLTAALRQFRSEASRNQEPLKLWIDALCINQTDAWERQFQVGMMKYIFRGAMDVWIWLGESDEAVEKGLVTLIGDMSKFELHRKGAPAMPSLDEEVLHIKQLAAICALPYWRRGWTFQENMLPQRHICYGKSRIELKSWTLIASRCVLYVDALEKSLLVVSWYSSVYSLMSDAEKEFLNDLGQLTATFAPFAFAEEIFIKEMLERIKKRPDADDKPGLTYPDLPNFFRAEFFNNTFYRTSNPQDAVFVLSEVIPALADVELNYANTPEHIFAMATESILRNAHEGLRDLRQWFHPQASCQLPSWVFDFTHCNLDVDENGRESFVPHKTISESDASAGSFFRVVNCNGTSIHVAGFVFDEILYISHSVDDTIQPRLRFVELSLKWIQLAQLHCQAHEVARRGFGTYTRALIRTFGFDHRVKDFTLNDLGSPVLVRWEDGPLEILPAIFVRSRMFASAGNFGEKVVGLQQAVNRHLSRARFFVTRSLRMGLAPIDAVIGDRIAILASGNLPFVLRPVSRDYVGEEAYRIIGGCYVDGMRTQHAAQCNRPLTTTGRFNARGSRVFKS
jgi:hypothetical protein